MGEGGSRMSWRAVVLAGPLRTVIGDESSAVVSPLEGNGSQDRKAAPEDALILHPGRQLLSALGRDQARSFQVGAHGLGECHGHAEPAGDVIDIRERAVRDPTKDDHVQIAQLPCAHAGRHAGMWHRHGASVNW